MSGAPKSPTRTREAPVLALARWRDVPHWCGNEEPGKGQENPSVMDFADRETVNEVARVAQELQMGDGIIADLANQGLLTDQARMMSVHIWQNYNQAVTASVLRFERTREVARPRCRSIRPGLFLSAREK